MALLRVAPLAIVLAGLVLNSRPLQAQRGSAPVSLEDGDRVRVWQPEAGLRGATFEFEGREGGSLFLRHSSGGSSLEIRSGGIERLEIRRRTGSHGWEGLLAGAGVGLVGIGAHVYSASDEIMAVGPGILLWTVPPALLGGFVGLAFPKHAWVSVDLGPPAGGTTRSSGPGAAIGLELTLPGVP